MNTFLRLDKQKRKDLYKSQYNYYKKFNSIVLFLIVISSLTYFISDCQLFGRFSKETFIPRFSILVIYAIYKIITRKSKDFYIDIIGSHIVGHCIMWCTIWSIYYLPNKQYASDGFIVMQLAILMLDFAAPFEIAASSQMLIIINILLSNTFNHYEDLNLMLSLGLPCSIGISLAQLVFKQSYYETYKVTKELERMSYIDQLTDVYNRHKLDEITLNGKLSDYNILQYVSFIIIDIDFFKRVNDTYGHDIGDVILKKLAKILKKYVDDNNYIIRWGGEEFLLILYDYTEDKASELAEKIRKHVENDDNGIIKVTISLGIAKYNNISCNEAVKRADEALYFAKNTGRNKAVKYSTLKNKI